MKQLYSIGLVLFAFCLLCRFFRVVADFYATYLYPGISSVISWMGARLPFSLEEIVVLAFIFTLVCILVKAIKNKDGFLSWLSRTAHVVIWIYVWFYMSWGNNYFRTDLYQRNCIRKIRVEKEAFTRFLTDYAMELNRAADDVDVIDPEILELEIRSFYSDVVASYGYTTLHRWQHVKRPIFNPLFSAVTVKGFFGAFFCECHVNRSLLEHEYPYVVAHEMGHLAGITSEAEACYWGFEYCRRSVNAAVRYSGYLAVFPDVLSNARYLLSKDEYGTFIDSICDKAKADFSAYREYWSGKKLKWIESTQRRYYNLFLRSNGVSEGIKDYYGVVGMIITMDAWQSQNYS